MSSVLYPQVFYQLPKVVGYVDGHAACCAYPEITPAQQLLKNFNQKSVLAIFNEYGICIREGRMKQSNWWCDTSCSYEFLLQRQQLYRTCLIDYLKEQMTTKRNVVYLEERVASQPVETAADSATASDVRRATADPLRSQRRVYKHQLRYW